MKDFIKKSMLMGLGLAAITRDKAEKLGKQIADYSKMSEEEGRELVEYLSKESKKAHKDLQEKIDRMVDKAAERLPGSKRYKELEARVQALEEKTGIRAKKKTAAGGTRKKRTSRKTASGKTAASSSSSGTPAGS